MKRLLLLGLALATASPAPQALGAQRRLLPAPAQPASLTAIADEVSEASLRSYVEKLVSFGTRHTLSSQSDPERGIGAAMRWVEEEFGRIGRGCGGCIAIARPEEIVTRPPRVPTPTRIWNVLGIQRGTSDPNRVVIISGHIDSRVTDVMNAAADAPGANDDGSGTAAVIEAARILSRHRFPATIVYAVLAGEEQGLHGGRILASYAREQGWQVEANLNNDIIGNSCGSDSHCDAATVRVFSEGLRWQGGDQLRGPVRSLGGENDSPSRNLSRYLADLAGELGLGLEVRQIWRNDRFGRGGDHTELLNAGYPAVRLSVAVENYNHQHQNLRVENRVRYGDTVDQMDFPYLRRVTALNAASLAALARAPMPPEPRVEGAVQNSTFVHWVRVPGAAAYMIRWRRTDAANWQHSRRVLDRDGIPPPAPGGAGNEVSQQRVIGLPGIRVDDWLFGVSSVAADGAESPIASAVPGGAFRPWTSPPVRR